MAAAFAYEQPTLERAWQSVLLHGPTLLLLAVSSVAVSILGQVLSLLTSVLVVGVAGSMGTDVSDALSVIALASGSAVQLPFLLVGSLLGVLFTAIPALHYESGITISPGVALQTLLQRPGRYLLAGLLFAAAISIGLVFCLLPGIAISLVAPVYVNRIFNSEAGIAACLQRALRSVYGSEHRWRFLGIQLLTGVCVLLASLCTCGLGALVAVPLGSFYIQNCAYHLGILR